MRKPIKLPDGYNYPTINIPIELFIDHNLSFEEIFLMKEVYDLHENKGCFATNQHFADYLGVSVPRVKQIISSLIKREYLTAEYEYNKNSKIVKTRILKPARGIENYPYQSIENYPTQGIENYTDRINNIKNNNKEEYIDSNNGLDIYSHNNIKELRSDKPGLKDYEKPLMHSMEDAINGLTESGNSFRGIEINDSFIDKMMYVAKSYADRYYKEYDKPHPYINANDEFSPMQEVVLRFIDGDRSIADLSEKDIDTTIDLFFKNKKFMDSNHRISLFSMPDIWIRRVKEMERLEDKPNFYGIGLWQLPESEPDGWWTQDKMPDEWNECSKIAL